MAKKKAAHNIKGQLHKGDKGASKQGESELLEMKEENEKLQETIDTQVRQIDELKSIISAHEDNVAELEDDIDSLKLKIESDKGFPDDPSPKIAELEKKIIQYESTNKSLNHQVSELQSQVGTASSSIMSIDNIDVSKLDTSLVANCIGKITDRNGNLYRENTFLSIVEEAVQQAVVLASTITNATKDDLYD